MSSQPLAADPPPQERTRDAAQWVWAGVALALVAVPFALLLLLVEDHWGPLQAADQGARDDLHRYALTRPLFVEAMRVLSDSGSALAWQVVVGVCVVWLLWRRLWRLAIFTAVTVAGSSLLNTVVKTLVHRTRPVVTDPFVHEPGASFPSGHAQAAIVGYGVLLLVFLPVLPVRWRRPVVVVAAVLVVAIGFSRVALAAHYVSDVVGGFVLGAAWLAALTALFSAWRLQRGRAPVAPAEGLAPEDAARLDPT